MLEPTSLIPGCLAPVAGAAIVWGALNYFGLTPIVEERLAEKFYQPACETGLRIAEESRPEPVTPRPINPRLEALKLYRPLFNQPLFKQFGLDKLLDETERLAQEMTPKIPEPTREPVDYESVCACGVWTAIDAHHVEFTVYTSSLRFYTPAAIRNFESEIAEAVRSGTCAPLSFEG